MVRWTMLPGALLLPMAAWSQDTSEAEEAEETEEAVEAAAPEEAEAREEAEAPEEAEPEEAEPEEAEAPEEIEPEVVVETEEAVEHEVVAPALPSRRYAPVVGIQLGPSFSLSPLRTAFMPRLELGVELPQLGRRLRPFLAVAHARPVRSEDLQDPRVDGEDWSYVLRQAEWALAPGLTVRVPDLGGPIVPEASLAAVVYLLRTRTEGHAATGSDFGDNIEQYTRGGIHASLGASLDLGPGEAVLSVAFGSSGLNGLLSGPSLTAAVSPMLGYRLVL